MNHNVSQKQEKQQKEMLEMVIKSFEIGAISRDGYYPIQLNTSRGIVNCRFYASESRMRAAVFVGGEDGGWDTPVRSLLYPHLCDTLARQNINCLRIQYRYPLSIAESILDVLAGITFLVQDGVESIGLVGYSQGVAVAIQTAAASPLVSTVVGISPRVFGFNAISSFRNDQSILMLHGSQDSTSSTSALALLYNYAHNPKKIIFYSNVGKSLDGVAPEVASTVQKWLHDHVK